MRKRLATILIIYLLLSSLFYSCSSNKGYLVIRNVYRTNDSIASIRGKVVDEKTSDEMPGAMIRIGSMTVTSDVKGEYKISNVPTGKVEVEVMYLGYYTIKEKLKIDLNTIIELDFKMSPLDVEIRDMEVTQRESHLTSRSS